MDPQDQQPNKKKLTTAMAIVIIVVVVALVVVAMLWWKQPGGGAASTASTAGSGDVTMSSSTGSITSVAPPTTAYGAASARAAQWTPDAALFQMALTSATSEEWSFTFTSLAKHGTALVVAVSGETVVSANEMPYYGSGQLPPANLITPDQAIALARQTPAYANAVITAVDLTYSTTGNRWFWGITTASGTTLAVNATP